MQIIPAQLAKNQFGDLLMKVQREPVEISKHGKRVAVVISPEEYEQFEKLKLQSLKAVLAESIAQAERGELYSVEDVFSPLAADELNLPEDKA
ncbi:type II toxin-antitoxin system Phd/YefM family antitoxin [Jinshanibacter sp. LJY008]|uniref:Antitoxin n=1 Tax=Limnobaculum eriocheiris TaxID=2897391 RepID=A0A9X1SR71_9GAMM|nr:type II toxin-antitoxin system Phd/YefM family antitoxin [Limnobaculum eriocheiris]MCD1127567.1 type II toxin-antitoxin system Phd/YefM family antitoxin [Limnobaculum eriocheiris]